MFTADEGKRGGKTIELKKTVDAAVALCPDVKKVFVYQRTGEEINMVPGRDVWMDDELLKVCWNICLYYLFILLTVKAHLLKHIVIMLIKYACYFTSQYT